MLIDFTNFSAVLVFLLKLSIHRLCELVRTPYRCRYRRNVDDIVDIFLVIGEKLGEILI